LERRTIGYILVFVCIFLAINVSLTTNDLLVLNLQLSLLNPDSLKDEKLFNARFLYSADAAYLDGDPDWKDAVREKIVDEQMEQQRRRGGEKKSREALMEGLIANEQKSFFQGQPRGNVALAVLIVLIVGGTGIHFIAKFVTTPSWSIIEVAPPLPVFSIGFGALSLLAFFIAGGLAFLREIYGPLGYLAPVIGMALMLLLISQYLRTRDTSLWREIGLVDVDYRRAIGVGIAGFFVFFPLQIIINTQGLLLSYSLGFFPQAHPAVEEFVETSSTQLRVIIAAVVILSAPFIEEIFFRGLFLRSLMQKLSPAVACIICGFVFGLVHGSFINVFLIFFLGVHLAFLMQKTGSVITPIVVHFLFNAHSMIQVLLLK